MSLRNAMSLGLVESARKPVLLQVLDMFATAQRLGLNVLRTRAYQDGLQHGTISLQPAAGILDEHVLK